MRCSVGFLGLGLASFASPLVAQVEDAAMEFSATMNPIGNWSYGRAPAPGGSMTLLTSIGQPFGPSLDTWYYNGPGFTQPSVSHNGTAMTLNIPQGLIVQPGQLLFHPAPDGQHAVVRWTAPAAGTYSFAFEFELLDLQGGNVDVHVVLNGAEIFADGLMGVGDLGSYQTTRVMSAGDIMECTVGFGSDGVFNDDSTALVFRVMPPGGATISISPDHGPTTGSSGVVLTGSGFSGATEVRFGPNTVSYTVDSDTQITADLASTTTTGWVDVTVTTPMGSTTQTDGFDYFRPPGSTFGACSTPRLTWSGYPTLGQHYTVTTQDLGTNNQMLLVDWAMVVTGGRGNSGVGSAPTIGHQTRPCLFYANPDFQIALGNTPSHTFSIPNDAVLLGLKLVTQAVVYSTTTVTTNILAASIGE